MCCLLTPKLLVYQKRCWLQESLRLSNPMFRLEKFDQQMKKIVLWCLQNWIQYNATFLHSGTQIPESKFPITDLNGKVHSTCCKPNFTFRLNWFSDICASFVTCEVKVRPILKVRQSREQIMVSPVPPKNEQKNIKEKMFLIVIFVCFSEEFGITLCAWAIQCFDLKNLTSNIGLCSDACKIESNIMLSFVFLHSGTQM